MEAKMVRSIIPSKSDELHSISDSFDARISTGTAPSMRKGACTIFCPACEQILNMVQPTGRNPTGTCYVCWEETSETGEQCFQPLRNAADFPWVQNVIFFDKY